MCCKYTHSLAATPIGEFIIMSTKFEQLLDLLINEEHEKANELFHEIVVEKSRDIYENLIAEEEDEEMDEAADEDMDEGADEDMDESADEDMDESADEDMDEGADEDMDESDEELEDSYMMDGEEDGEIGGDATDDFGAEVGADHGEMDHEGGEDQAIYDIKSAIEELEAAFAELEKAQGMETGDDFGDEEGGEEGGEDDMMMGKPAFEGRRMTREYTEKVGNDWEKNSQKTAGPVGSGSGDKAGQTSVSNTKSPVSSGKGKPTTGATAANILGDSSVGKGKNTGDRPDSLNKGIAQVAGEKFAKGMHNVDGVKSGVKTLNKQGSGYPGNNKTAGPVGSGTGDKAGQTSVGQAKSPLNGAPNRNA